jgi:dephospho-CoA kinase
MPSNPATSNPTPRRKPVIGLMGAPGSGKSLCARQFAKLGCAVIDADQIAKDALDEPDVRGRLQQWWGPAIIGPDGQVDRSAVGQIVFQDPAQLDRLESLIHPLVHRRREQLHQLHQADPSVRAIVEDCPLLLEKQLQSACDVLVYVDAPRELRLQRLREQRGWSEQELTQRENHQLPLDIKRQRADYVLDNSAGEAYCYQQARRVLSQILQERA